MQVVVVGAGPAGLSAAYELAQAGVKVQVYEQDPDFVGGISRTVEYKGFRFDIGGHRFFSKSQEIEEFWSQILGPDLLTRPRQSRIFYQGKFFDYPLRPLNAFFNMGLVETIRCLADYTNAKMHPHPNPQTFEDWVINHFGERLYRMFFKTYTEKVWGVDCAEISADWAAQRIKGLSLSSAIINAFKSKTAKNGQQTIKTLIDEFRYPTLGPGMLWERVAQHIVQLGGEIHMGTKITQLSRKDNAVTAVSYTDQAGQSVTVPTDHVISTMPVRSLFRSMGQSVPDAVQLRANALKYRDFITVSLIIDTPHLFSDNWIYIHDPRVKVGRIQNFKNWSPFMVPDSSKTCLGLEYFCFEGDGLWTSSDDQLLALAENELRQIGLLNQRTVLDGTVIRVPKAYPVYDDEYKEHLTILQSYLHHHATNVQLVGRNGMHRYNNQDHAMMTGFLAARNILGGQYDLWAVNGDAEYLEDVADERLVPSRITAQSKPVG